MTDSDKGMTTAEQSGIGGDMSGKRNGMVALVGRANAGKSTLMNCILGEKVSIVSPVAQTTRNVIRGIRTEPRGQMVLLDTPGILTAKHDLSKRMNQVARRAVEGVDAAVLVLDGSAPPRAEDEAWMRALVRQDVHLLMAVNKMDVGREHEEAYRQAWAGIAAERTGRLESQWMAVSAKTGRGVDELTDALFGMLPEGPMLFPEEMLTDFPRRWNISDIIREKLFAVLTDEIPHSVAVGVDKLHEEPDRWAVQATIYVAKPTQKPIVIGHKGRLIRKVTRQAEAELKAIYEKEVHLEVWVKVEKNWDRNFWILRRLGYA